MKKIVFCGIIGLGLSYTVSAQKPVSRSAASEDRKPHAATPKAGMEKKFAAFKFFETDNLHDFGNIPEGPKVSYDFTFINEGNMPLIITNAQASCGCTSPTYPKEPILPGKRGKISVTYTTEGHPGNFNKSIYLTSNAQTTTIAPNGESKYELIIKGIVTPVKK